MAANVKAWAGGFKRAIGDASLGPTLALALDNTTKQIHICDIEDVNTDWGKSNDSYPTVYIHDIAEPITDYVRIYHDGTNGIIDCEGTTILSMTATSLDIAGTLGIVGDVTVTGGVTWTAAMDVTLTAPTTADSALYGLITASAAWAAGNMTAVRGLVTLSGTNNYVSATGGWFGLNFATKSGSGSGLTCAINAEITSNNAVAPNAIVYLQSLPNGSSADFSNVPFIAFTEYAASGTGSNILFSLGHQPAGSNRNVTTGTSGNIIYQQTLHIIANGSDAYIPYSTVAGAYTTAYLIQSSLATDATNSTSGAVIIAGGVGIAKKLFVGTNLDVNGTTQLDGTLTVGLNGTGHDVLFYGDTSGVGPFEWDADLNILKVGTTPTASAAGQTDGGGTDLADGNAFEVNADTGGAALGAVYRAAIKGNVVHGTTQGGAASTIGVLGKLNTNTTAFGGGDHYGVRGHVNYWGNTTEAGANGNVGGLSAYIENEGTTTIPSGSYLCGVCAYQVGAPTIQSTGVNPAIWIRSSNAAANWGYGIYMATAAQKVLYATTTPTTAQAAVEINVNDTATLAAGRGIGLFVDYIANGAHTSNYGVRSTRVNTQILANVPSVICGDWYIHTIEDKTITWLMGLSMYWEDYGNAVEALAMLDMGINSPHEVTGYRHHFIRCREHTLVPASSAVLGLEGTNAAAFLIDFDAPADSGNGCLVADSDNTDVSYGIKVYLRAHAVTKYIHLHDA